jgi:hypothetical protein
MSVGRFTSARACRSSCGCHSLRRACGKTRKGRFEETQMLECNKVVSTCSVEIIFVFSTNSSAIALSLSCHMLRDCIRMSDFVHSPAAAESPPQTAVESAIDLSASTPASSSECFAFLPCSPPHALSLAQRHFNRHDPMQIFASWLTSFGAPQFPRDRLFECCRDFLSTTLPSWTVAFSPDATFSTSPVIPASIRGAPTPQPHGFKFASSCVPSDCAGPSSILPFHRCCAFEWKDEAAWSFHCSALAHVTGQQIATWILACTSATAVHSFVITGRVSLGSLSCFRADSHQRGIPTAPAICQLPFARFLLVAVPHGDSGLPDGSKKWLNDLKSITQIECLRSGYPNHDLSVPFSSPFMFPQQRRFGMGQPRLFSSSFGHPPNKRANFGSS